MVSFVAAGNKSAPPHKTMCLPTAQLPITIHSDLRNHPTLLKSIQMAAKQEMINELGLHPVRTSSLSSDNDPPRPCFLARTSRCETNLHHLFWESSSATAQRTRPTTTFEDLGSSSDVDTESTASESDSPNFQDYYYSDYNLASTRCLPRRKQQSSLQSVCCASHDPIAGTNHHPQGFLAGLKETLILRGGIGGGTSQSPYKQATVPSIKMEDTSSATTIGHHRRTTQRSSNIPVQRLTRGSQRYAIAMSNCDDSSDVAEKALQAQLQAHYTMRTWDMYHRITQSRKKTTCSPAMAASIDCLLHSSNTARSSPNRPIAHQPEPGGVPPTHMMDTMLDQEMLFPLDD